MTLPDFLTRDRYGEIRLKGYRIGLFHIVFFYNRGETAGAMASRFPSLAPELINDVIDFYKENKSEIGAYVAACQAEIDEQRAATPDGPSLSELRKRRKAVTPRSAS
jgi:uncharacterized protein (DUF433 family)